VKSKAAPALAILFLVNVLNFYDRLALGAILEPLRHEFQLSDTQLGALITWFTVVLALAGLPLGRLADRGSRRKLLAAGIAVWAGLTGLAAVAASYAMLLMTRLGVGIGEAVCAPVATSWIGDLVPAERRARAMAGFMLAIPVGGLLSYSITGPVAQVWGWRAALAIAAAPVFVLVPVVLWLNEPRRADPIAAPGVGGSGGLGDVLRVSGFWWIAASGAIVNFALYAFSTFMPAFLTRYHGASVGRAGVWMGLGTGVSGILGGAAVSAIGDRVRSRLGLASIVSLIAAAPLFGALRAGSLLPAVLLAMAGYGLLQMYYGLVYAAIQDRFTPAMRATAMAAYLMVTYLGGASWGPVATGKLSDVLARRAAGAGAITEAARASGLHDAMYVIPALAVILSAVLWLAATQPREEAPEPPLADASVKKSGDIAG
jgi:predicted MFS family arabinose efflux permease